MRARKGVCISARAHLIINFIFIACSCICYRLHGLFELNRESRVVGVEARPVVPPVALALGGALRAKAKKKKKKKKKEQKSRMRILNISLVWFLHTSNASHMYSTCFHTHTHSATLQVLGHEVRNVLEFWPILFHPPRGGHVHGPQGVHGFQSGSALRVA